MIRLGTALVDSLVVHSHVDRALAFTARCWYAFLSVCLSVCLSVTARLSNADTASQWLYVLSTFYTSQWGHHLRLFSLTIALQNSDSKILNGALNTRVRIKNCINRPKSPLIWKTVRERPIIIDRYVSASTTLSDFERRDVMCPLGGESF